MSQPVWVTQPGSLGTIPEGVFYSIPLVAVAPADTVYYQVIAGALPTGMFVNESGILGGNPSAQATAQGVPAPVPIDITSKFAVRAYTEKVIAGRTVIDRLADRTFTITVTGQNTPVFVTPPGTIATYYDGTQVSDLQVQVFTPDIYAEEVVTLISGSLPPGLTISTSGIISGYVGENTTVTPTPTETNYPFTLRVTNGVAGDVRAFNILVYARSAMTADNTVITADNTFITADVSPQIPPIILTPTGSIGTTRSNNFYTFQFTGVDFNDQAFQFIANTTPTGLTLDPNSGWLYGYIPPLGLASITYPFSVRVYETANPDVISNPYNYSLTVTGPLSGEVTWLTPSNLGTIDNGTTSTLYVAAISASGLSLQYQLVSGSASRLPQGLELLTSGDIAGRVSFDTFALDGGTTTFDVTTNPLYNTVINPATSTTETTFDLSCTFTVNAFSVNGVVNATQTFTITVIRQFNEPFDNLYIQAMPPQNDRTFVNTFLQNSTIFPPSSIYRYNDPNFGVARNIFYYHAYGLTAATLDDYVSSLNLNHYWKNLVLGSIQTAQALDDNGNILYEIVYSKIIDDLVNNQGQSVGKEVTLAYPVQGADSTEITTVYPNSLVNMRTQVIDVVGQVSNVLPRWMVSKQTNGQVLGFIPAWVIAYCKPGQSGQIAYNIKTAIGDALNVVDYQVDRYELDNLLTKNWNREEQQWIPTPPSWVSFDVQCHYQLPVPNDSSLIFTGGINYAVGDRIRILGSQIGGVNGVYNPDLDEYGNNVIITVEQVDEFGTIQQARAQGLAPLNSAGELFYNIVGTNITGTGTGATWDIETVPGVATTFDGNSMQFTAPVDMYSNTQAYDKYLVFPKRNILE
jgi:hypothetical protein